jgi:hypothetical protein
MRTVTTAIAAAFFLTIMSVAATAEEGQAPDATFRISSTSIAAGIGVTWGGGELDFQGKKHKIKVTGLSVVDLGISSASASGRVYNLGKIEDIEGKYMAAKAGATVGGGGSAITMTNDKGVTIDVTSASTGAQLTLATEGVNISLDN